jgi:hypothetical protein
VPSIGIDPSTGIELFLDPSGRVTDLWQPSAKQYFGVSEPTFRGNVSTLFTYRDLSLNLSFGFHWGGRQYNTTLINKVEVTRGQMQYNVDRRVYTERWLQEGDVKPFKRYDDAVTKASSRFVMNDNVFELQSASLQYRWRTRFLRDNLGLEALNVSVNMSDVFYLSSIKRERGIDYPFSRRISTSFSFIF